MELTGLTISQVLTTLGAAGLAVVLLYLLKLRRRPVSVPFVKLWEQILAEKRSTRLFSQLKRILSLLIALAIVTLLAFALGDPRYTGATSTGRTLVVLVDTSASMEATDVPTRRLGLARTEVRKLIEGLGPADRMLVAQMDATTTPVSPMSGEPRILLDAVDTLATSDVRADLGAGLQFALDVLRDAPGAEVVLLSDGRLDPPGPVARRLRQQGVRISWVRVGRSGRNVAITAFSVRRYPLDKSQSEVLVELWNPSRGEANVELSLLGDGEPIDVERLHLAPGERLRRFFGTLSGADRTLEARISRIDGTQDYLATDDRAYARLPARRRARVLAVSPGNLYLSAALLLDEYLDVTEITPAQYPAAGSFDVTIFDEFVPPTPPPTHAIYIHPVPADGVEGPLEVVGTLERPFFDRVDRHHPLTRWTALRDVNVSSALKVRLRDGDRAVASDERGALIVAGHRAGHRMVAFTFDVRQSDLPLRVAWPLLLLNTIDWFVEEDAGYVSGYRTGEVWHIPAPSDAHEAVVIDPSGASRSVPVVDGRAVYAGTRSGFYTLRYEGHEDETFAANLGPGEEARIEPVEHLELDGREATRPSRGKLGARRELWVYLVLFALGVVLVEWFTYHRRWTV